MARRLQSNKGKSLAKHMSGEDLKKGFALSDGAKRALAISAGIAVLGTLTYVNRGNLSKIARNVKLIRGTTKLKPGSVVGRDAFLAATTGSQGRVWNKRLINKKSFQRKPFTIPKGHKFSRLSTANEKSFNPGTYAVASSDDFTRYVAGYSHELGLGKMHRVSFSSKAPINVPDLKTSLKTFRNTMSRVEGRTVSSKEALAKYESMSGGGWMDDLSKSFFQDLIKDGYGAIVDEMDFGVLGDAPMVFIDPSILTGKTSKILSDVDVAKAFKTVKELTNRR